MIGLTKTNLAGQAPPNSAPTLTAIGAVHNLSAKEASKTYPVRLQAVITYYDPYINASSEPFLIVTDSTGSIYVSTDSAAALPLKPGVLVEVTGQTTPGLFARPRHRQRLSPRPRASPLAAPPSAPVHDAPAHRLR